ncbi:MAG TPA: TonB-dependent receptor [Candidatus Koribacter sp.]
MKSLVLALTLLLGMFAAFAQAPTGEIAGTVKDASGAIVTSASITVFNKDNGTQRSSSTNKDGIYRVPLLPPGSYMVTVSAKSFQTLTRDQIDVEIGHAVHLDFNLQVGSLETKIEVSGETPLLEPTNPNTTTTYNTQNLVEVPNSGNDMSHVAVIAPGAIMNVTSAGGYAGGNVEFNGLSSVANDFRVDGLDANDTWENTNRNGATGLQLGMAAVQEASVTTEGYGADQSSYGASQVNFVTKSGTNAFHGSLMYLWNGSAMNSENYFTKMLSIQDPSLDEKKPRSNVNQFSGTIGGPIIKNKLFFFGSVEGTRIVLPALEHAVLPTPQYESYVLSQLPVGGFDPALGVTLPGQPAEVGQYQKLFSTLGNTAGGTAVAAPGCPFDTPNLPEGGCASQHNFSVSPPADETLYTAKVDYNITPKDATFYRMQWDDGKAVSPSATNSIWNLGVTWPQRSVVASWTHTFSPNLLNEFSPGFNFWSRVHQTTDPHATDLPIMLSAVPFSLFGSGQNIYGNSTRMWVLADNLTWNKGKHSFKFGNSTRHSRFGSFESSGYAVIPFVYTCSLYEFTYGAACQTYQAFPTYGIDHISNTTVDNYALDTFRVTDKLTITYGVRLGFESNPISQESVLSRLAQPFESISHDVNQPLNQVLLGRQSHLFASTYPLKWQPRLAVAYQLTQKTVLRAGGGVFANPTLGFIPSYSDENAPSDIFVQGGIFGPAGGIGMFPGVPGSAIDADAAAARQFQQNFASGAVSCAAPGAPANCVPPVTFQMFDSQKQKFPDIYQWSAAIEQQFGNNWGLTARYVGTRSTHSFYTDAPNSYQTFCQGCFTGYSYGQSIDPRFGQIFPFKTGASSSYHGLQISGVKKMSHGLTFQANYTWSHCIDDGTNGGVIIFNENTAFSTPNNDLKRLRGNCDFDFRHSLNGSYIYELPFHSNHGLLNGIIGGWQVAGTIFARDGLPFSVFSSSIGGFVNGYPQFFANVVPGQSVYDSSRIPKITNDGEIQYLNPNAFASVFNPTNGECYPATNPTYCQQGDTPRNAYRSPNFVWSDFSLTKRFTLRENLKLRIDMQAYNIFNHPNFGLPNGAGGYPGNATAGIPGETGTLNGFGTISTTVGPATSLLGAQNGGDSSVRMIALRLGLDF